MSKEMTKRMNSTIVKTEGGTKVQPTIPIAVNQILVQMGESGNKHTTKGRCAYEVIHMYSDDFEDVIDQLESEIDRQLDSEDVDLVEEVLFSDDRLDEYGSMKKAQRGLFLTETFNAELPARGKGSLITDAVEYYIRTPFFDRKHRIDTKRAILEFVRGERVEADLPPLAAEWINIEPVPDSDSESEEEYEGEWWENVSSVEELREKGDRLNQKQKEERVKALETAVQNDNRHYHEIDVQQLIRDVWNIQSEATINDYLDRADYQLTVEASDFVLEANSIVDSIKSKNKVFNTYSAENLANLDSFLAGLDMMGEVDAYRYRDALEQTLKNDLREIDGPMWKKVKLASKGVREELIPMIQEELEYVEEQIQEGESA